MQAVGQSNVAFITISNEPRTTGTNHMRT